MNMTQQRIFDEMELMNSSSLKNVSNHGAVKK